MSGAVVEVIARMRSSRSGGKSAAPPGPPPPPIPGPARCVTDASVADADAAFALKSSLTLAVNVGL